MEQSNRDKEEEVKRRLRREMIIFNIGVVILLLLATLVAILTICQSRDCFSITRFYLGWEIEVPLNSTLNPDL
jgi:hypothetical protein